MVTGISLVEHMARCRVISVEGEVTAGEKGAYFNTAAFIIASSLMFMWDDPSAGLSNSQFT